MRLNSTFTPNWIGEFAFGAHFQRNNTIPPADLANLGRVRDNFAIVRNGAVLPVIDTNINFGAPTGFLAFVDGRGGSLERGYDRQGFAPPEVGNQERNRYELQARLVTIYGRHSLKYGFGFAQNRHRVNVHLTGPTRDFGSGVVFDGFAVLNSFGVCTVQGSTIVCPAAGLTNRVNALIAAGQAPAGLTRATTNTSLTAAQLSTNPFLIRSTTNVADANFNTGGEFTTTNVESFYLQDDFKIVKKVQLSFGLRWDYQQAYAGGSSYLKLNSFKDNVQPRVGFTWDFTGEGRGKVFVNFARFLEAPIPLSVNVIAGGHQAIFSALVNRLNAPPGSTISVNQGFCCSASPIDSDLKPQTLNEVAGGVEYEVIKDIAIGFRGVYRAQDSVIEDGSLNEGSTYFLFNPGESESERLACASQLGCFGRARRYYRGLEFTATRRFTRNYQLIASYVFSNLNGNYEGLYRNDTDETFTISSGIPGANSIQFPNPSYGQGRIFQFPSSVRLGLKFQF